MCISFPLVKIETSLLIDVCWKPKTLLCVSFKLLVLLPISLKKGKPSSDAKPGGHAPNLIQSADRLQGALELDALCLLYLLREPAVSRFTALYLLHKTSGAFLTRCKREEVFDMKRLDFPHLEIRCGPLTNLFEPFPA